MESSPDVSWLHTTTSATTPSKSIPTPTDFLKLAQDNQLKAKYDAKLQKLQADLLQKERELEIFRVTLERTSKSQELASNFNQKELKAQLQQVSAQNESLKSENKTLNSELAGLKVEMAVLGSEPVKEAVIDKLKNRPHQSVRQVAEIRVHELLKPFRISVRDKDRMIERLNSKIQDLERRQNDNEGLYAGAQEVKSTFQDQVTRQRLELVDARNRLTESQHIIKEHAKLRAEVDEQTRCIAQLTAELAHTNEKYEYELSQKIQLEKQTAIIQQQLTITSSDKQFLERDRADEKSKNHGLSLDLQTQWKELEQQRLQAQRALESNAQTETTLLETRARLERTEQELLNTQRQLAAQTQTAREATLRAQHDTDLVHEKLLNLQNVKAAGEDRLRVVERELFEARQEGVRIKGIYGKDVDILEGQLLEAQRAQESIEAERLRAVAQVKQAAIDIDTLQDQLQIIYQKHNSPDPLTQVTAKSSNFNLADLNVPGIDDLEESVYNKPFATAIILAKRLHELYHDPEKANHTASNTKLRKQLTLKQTNETKLKQDVQNLLQLVGQVSRMRALLKNLAAVDGDKNRVKQLESEYRKLAQCTPVNIIE